MTKEKIFLSIIIPTWNEEDYLPKLLGCLKKQAFKNYEIIVADANSTDKTRQIARKYGCKIANSGGHPGIGRNNGAKKAKGKILLFLDADVKVESNFLENAVNEINNRDIDVAGTRIYPLSNKIIDKIFLGIFNFWISATQKFYQNAFGGGIFCKKKLHEKINGFDETIKLSEDMDYVKRAGKFGKFRILKSVKIGFSMRRYDNEGRLKVGLKLLLSVFHRIFLGEIKSDVFKYEMKYKK